MEHLLTLFAEHLPQSVWSVGSKMPVSAKVITNNVCSNDGQVFACIFWAHAHLLALVVQQGRNHRLSGEPDL
jgi:hypothetical protein